MVDRLTPENIEQYGITWQSFLSDNEVVEKEHRKSATFYAKVATTIPTWWIEEVEASHEIEGEWISENTIVWHTDNGFDIGHIKAMIRPNGSPLVSPAPEPKTIQIFHEPIKPSKSAALSYADTLVSNVKSMLEAGNITEDEAFSMLEQAAAAKEMSTKAYEDLRDYLGNRKGQNYLYGSGSKFEVKGGSKMNYDYSNCDSIKEFDNDLKALEAQVKALKAAKSAREKQIASAYEAQRYGDLKRITEDGVEITDIPTPIPGNTTYAFTLAK